MEPFTLYIFENNGRHEELLKLPNSQVVNINFFRICNYLFLATEDYFSKMKLKELLNFICAGINIKVSDYIEELDDSCCIVDNPTQLEHFKDFYGHDKDLLLFEIKLMNMVVEKILDGPNTKDESPSIRFCNLDKILLPEEYRHIAWMENRITPLEIGELLVNLTNQKPTISTNQKDISVDKNSIIKDFAKMLILIYHRQSQLTQGITAVSPKKRIKRSRSILGSKDGKQGDREDKTIETEYKNVFSKYYISSAGLIPLAWAEILYAIENDLKVKKCIRCGRYANLEGKESLCSDECKKERKSQQDRDKYIRNKGQSTI